MTEGSERPQFKKRSHLYVNVGSGPHAIQGWVNTDRSPNILIDRLKPLKTVLRKVGLLSEGHMVSWSREIILSDIRKGLPFETGTVDAIYSSHTLEHLYLSEAKRVLLEFRRVLVPNGILRLALPNGLKWAEDLIAGESAGDRSAALRFNERLLMQPQMAPSIKDTLSNLVGGHTHRWQPTPLLATTLLEDAGFTAVESCNFREGRRPDLARVEHRPESFFLEASWS